MSLNGKLYNSDEDVNKNFEKEFDMEKIRKELAQSFSQYKKTMKFMYADLPIQALCLPSRMENSLLKNGFLRVYDLFDLDFTKVKIKGLGRLGIRELTSRLDQFVSMG